MPRLKTYYAESEITKNLYTTGKQWMFENFTEYIGTFHIYTTGEVYSESEYNSSLSKRLIPFRNETNVVKSKVYKQLKFNLQTKYKTLSAVTPIITKKDIKLGYIDRYFFKKVNENKVVETNKTNYDAYYSGRHDKNLYSMIKMKWIITGDTQDVIKNNITTRGVITKNNIFKQAAIRKMPELETVLTDPLQYYVDDTYNIPVDINGLDS